MESSPGLIPYLFVLAVAMFFALQEKGGISATAGVKIAVHLDFLMSSKLATSTQAISLAFM